VNIVKYELALLFSRDGRLNATVDEITQVYCYAEYSVLTMQLPQHCTSEMRHNLPYTIMPSPHERKQLHESQYNSHQARTFSERDPHFLNYVQHLSQGSRNMFSEELRTPSNHGLGSNQSEMVTTTNSMLTQRQVGY